jgi:glycosyltransferase involved in cell wall biosynthesis
MGEALLLSVVVCTRDRARLLEGCLDSLARQRLSPGRFEVIVVDNGSSDDTAEVAGRHVGRHPNARYLREERRGLSHARNAGWKAARGLYVGYIDDDGRAPPEWLSTAAAVAEGMKPDLFGGPYRACYIEPKPAWWKDAYRSLMHAEATRPLRAGEYLSGNNLFLLRERIAEAGGFDASLGMRAGRPGYGEETLLIDAVRRLRPGALVLYVRELENLHVVQRDKMTLRWLFPAWLAEGRDYWLSVGLPSGARSEARPVRAILRAAVLFFCELAPALVIRDRERYPDCRNFIVERSSRHVVAIGNLLAQRGSTGRTEGT